jgi:DNA-binding MarR family transcriptional regulator
VSATKQTKHSRTGRPIRSVTHDGVVAIMRTADFLRRQTAAVVEPSGITMQQFNVLRILRGAAAAGVGGLPTLEVGERMVEQTPGVTRLLDRLEAKGLVRRQRCPKDRRQHLCWIMPEGLDLLASLDTPILMSSQASMKGLTPVQQATLVRLLEAIRAARE